MKISSLPPHLRDLARKRATKKGVDSLSLVFNWSKTPEGFEFWYDVNNGAIRAIPETKSGDDIVMNIKSILKEKNMNQRDLATMLNVSYAYVSSILGYNRPVTTKMANKISQVLDRVV